MYMGTITIGLLLCPLMLEILDDKVDSMWPKPYFNWINLKPLSSLVSLKPSTSITSRHLYPKPSSGLII